MTRQPNRQIGHINLVMKPIGKPGAGKPHAGFDYPDIGIIKLIPQNAASRLIVTNPHIKPFLHKNGGIIFTGLTHITA
jgi:hypothetical protein